MTTFVEGAAVVAVERDGGFELCHGDESIVGLVVGAALRQELTRPGSSLIPGYKQTNLRFAAAFSAAAVSVSRCR